MRPIGTIYFLKEKKKRKKILREFHWIFATNKTRSDALARIAAQHQPHSTVVADILSLPHPHAVFDFAISVAVVHHLSTTERRVQAIAAILRSLAPETQQTKGGTALIYVWALEQKSSRRGWDKGDQQDVMVPWVLRSNRPAAATDTAEQVFHRYYHLYQEGELEKDICAAGGRVVESGYEKDNWWAIATRPE
jgi:tRNA (uracil-5-)-methyltransferase TRM9